MKKKEPTHKAKGRTPSGGKKPKISIDWKEVKKLCRMQCTSGEVASFLDISEDTLQRASKEMFQCPPSEKFAEWKVGGHCSLRRKQWILADTSAAMAIFLGKQILHQEDSYGIKHKGDPIINIVNFGDKDPQPWKSEDAE